MRLWLALLPLLCPLLLMAKPFELTTAVQRDSAPKYLVQDEQLPARGLCVDILHAIEQLDPELHMVISAKPLPLTRLERSVQTGELSLLCGVGDTLSRRQQFHFIEPPLFSVRYQMAVRRDDPVNVAHWQEVRALGKEGIILVNRGSGPVERLRSLGGLEIDDGGQTTASNLGKLLSGRGRFFYYRSPGLHDELERLKLTERVRILPAVFEHHFFYLLATRGIPPIVLTRLRLAVQQLASDGTLDSLSARYD